MRFSILYPIIVAVVLLHACSSLAQDSPPEITNGYEKVTCASTIKLVGKSTGFRLHSHAVNYGTGSTQQSVTGFPDSDFNSFWTIRAAHGQVCSRGDPILCNSIIRLMHTSTQKLLHSHHHSSPLTNQQEVSAYDGEDVGDNWEIRCLNSKQTYWIREEPVNLVHQSTGVFLAISPQGTYGHPIPGQLEVAGTKTKNVNSVWLAQEGIFFAASRSHE